MLLGYNPAEFLLLLEQVLFILLNDDVNFVAYLLLNHLLHIILVLDVLYCEGVPHRWFLHLLHSPRLTVNTLNHKAINRLVKRLPIRLHDVFGFFWRRGVVECDGLWWSVAS